MVLKNKSDIKFVIFDLDGTLVNSKFDLADSVNFVRNKYGFNPLPADKVVSYLGNGITALVKSGLPELKNEEFGTAVKMFKADYAQHLTSKTIAYTGVLEMLSDILQPKVLLSNKDEKFSKQILKTLNLAGFFTKIYGGDSFKEKKPNPLPIYEIIKKFSLKKEEVVMIGDGTNDILAGKAAGIKTMAVLYGYSCRKQIEKLIPDYIAKDTNEVVKLIKNGL